MQEIQPQAEKMVDPSSWSKSILLFIKVDQKGKCLMLKYVKALSIKYHLNRPQEV